jgi:hypothetical protein
MLGKKVIHRDPTFSLKIFTKKENLSSSFPFNQENILLFGYGRVALYEGLKILNLKEGQSILVPNYICNVAVAPMHYLKVSVKFYEVDKNLNPIWTKIETQIDKGTKALLIINYFGFPNDLNTARKLCDKYGIYLIEDNAHSFLSCDDKRPLGSIGDISIFSFRKMMPIPNGAALLINNKSLCKKLPSCAYLQRRNKYLRFLAKVLLIKIKGYFGVTGYFNVKETDFDKIRNQLIAEEYNIEKYFTIFPQLAYFLLNHFNFEYIKIQRIKSYNEWLRLFSIKTSNKIHVLYPHLNDGVIPSYFPILAENQHEFILKMWKKGIECFPWPILPRLSSEHYFSSRMVCLPIFSEFNLGDNLNYKFVIDELYS